MNLHNTKYMLGVKEMYGEFCSGCGLCISQNKAQWEKDNKGFLVAAGKEKEFETFCQRVCPSSGTQCSEFKQGAVWGRYTGVYLSHAADEYIRFQASSGGVLTSICLFLLENKMADGIIQTKMDPDNPIGTKTCVSRTKEELLDCCGSRYSSSSPLEYINDYLSGNETYVYVGKPCDVTALRNFAKTDERVDAHIKYMFSFFCAGAPSEQANLQLLHKMGCRKEDCVHLRYRGDGWPGYATATDSSGGTYQLDYRSAWRDTLGRDIRKMCRFCLDGIGEMADISCGDAWYLGEDNKPVFTEAAGRNVVFCRTQGGKELFSMAYQAGYVTKSDYPEFEKELPLYQAYQYERRTTMDTTIFALKLMGKKYPRYKKELLKSYGKRVGFKHKLSRLKGTMERIAQKKI